MKATKFLTLITVGALSMGSLCAQGAEQGNKEGRMQQRRAEREQIRQKFEQQMKEQDAQLDKVAAEMNAATGEKKVDAVAAAVNTLIEQRKAMHSELEKLHEQRKARKGGAFGRGTPTEAVPSVSPAP